MIINHVALRTARRQEWMQKNTVETSIAFVHVYVRVKDVTIENESRMNMIKT